MEKLRSFITKLFLGKPIEEHQVPLFENVTEPPHDAAFRRLVVWDNEWRNDEPNPHDGLTFKQAVDISMNNFKSYSDELRSKMVRYQFRAVTEWVLRGLPETTFNEIFAYREELGGHLQNDAEALLAGVHRYSQLPSMEDFTTADEKTQEQVRALITVARKIPSNQLVAFPKRRGVLEDELVMLANDDFIQFVIDNSQYAELIADTISQRRITDLSFLKEMVASKAPSLSSGIL